jgi:type II secretory pathway component PulJ
MCGIDAVGRPVDPRRVHLGDLLVSLAVLGLLLAATLGVLEQGQAAYAGGAARVESQQTARVALARLASDLRQAGFGGPGPPAVAVAERTRVVLHMDLDRNGIIAGRGETVTWHLDGTILRRNAGGGAQPIVNGVVALTLEYRDARGLPTTAAPAVRAVTVRLTTRAAGRRGGGADTTVTTTVRLRNR